MESIIIIWCSYYIIYIPTLQLTGWLTAVGRESLKYINVCNCKHIKTNKTNLVVWQSWHGLEVFFQQGFLRLKNTVWIYHQVTCPGF